jgi:hypothetical protein
VSPVRQLPRTVDVLARDEGTIWLLTPVSDAGRTRLREHVEAEATWLGDSGCGTPIRVAAHRGPVPRGLQAPDPEGTVVRRCCKNQSRDAYGRWCGDSSVEDDFMIAMLAIAAALLLAPNTVHADDARGFWKNAPTQPRASSGGMLGAGRWAR